MAEIENAAGSRRHTPRAWAAGLLLTIVCLPLCFPAEAAELKPIRFVAPNGLTVLIIEQHSLPIVQLHALVKAGSAQDPAGKAGLANLTANLLDEGTATRSSTQLAEQIEFVGGMLATKASDDFTTVSAKVLKKDTELGFELLSDMLLHAAFPDNELRRVRSMILGEMQAEKDDPGAIASKAFRQLVFDGHPYGLPVNGTEESLAKLSRDDVRGFYAREYLPNQTILSIVGDLTEEQARGLVAKHFGAWKRAASPPRKVVPPPVIHKPAARLIQKDLTQATVALGHVGISRTNPDYYAVTVMNYILGAGGFSSRLMDQIRDNLGLAYGVMSVFDARLMPGAFLVSLQTRNETANQAIAGVLTELKGMRDKPVTDEEIAEAKAYLIGSFPLRLDTTAKLAEVLAQVEFFGLGLDYFTDYPKWIDKVTKEDVQRAAGQYLNPEAYALVVVANLPKANIKP